MNNDNEKTTAIFTVIGAIPEGKVSSYGKVAKRAGYKGAARYVGYLLKNLPADSSLPWHRVVNSQGKISFALHSVKYQQQRQYLLAEGVEFNGERVNLAKCGWH